MSKKDKVSKNVAKGKEQKQYVDPEIAARITNLKEEGYSRRKIGVMLGIPESTIRAWEGKGWLEQERYVAGGSIIRPHQKRKKLTGKRYVFTSAQNNTFVHEDFLKSIHQYLKHNDAELIVGTFSYNKSGFQNGVKEGEWYDPAIRPYILNESAEVFKGLIWCGELNILPTAITPLNGLDSYTKADSGIVPHAKVQMVSVPTAKHDPCKMLYTTGAITKANYVAKKAGQRAEFDHVYGAVVAEVDSDGDYFVRQLICDSDTGCFYDLDTLYTPDGIITGQRIEALNPGDIHAEEPDVELFEASFGDGGMLDDLKPKYLFSNDSLNFSTRNHHNIKDIYFRYKKQAEYDGKDLVENDIRAVVETFKRMSRPWCQTVAVSSNHDLALLRWLKESDVRYDNIWNAITYHKYQSRVLQAIAEKDNNFDIFEWACKDIDPDLDVKFLREDESFIICEEHGGGVECGQHGHNGANGSRGNPVGFTKLGRRHNTGHTHTAGIRDGVYTAGIKGNLEQGYNRGASSWSHSDIITYPNAKRCIITWKGNKYRAR
jgi:hypothetical protein